MWCSGREHSNRHSIFTEEHSVFIHIIFTFNRTSEYNIKGALDVFFNRGLKVNKFKMINYANSKLTVNKNVTEIMKNVVYGQENYLLRSQDEIVLSESIHNLILDMITDVNLKFDTIE